MQSLPRIIDFMNSVYKDSLNKGSLPLWVHSNPPKQPSGGIK